MTLEAVYYLLLSFAGAVLLGEIGNRIDALRTRRERERR